MRNVFQKALKKKGALKFMNNISSNLEELKKSTNTPEFKKIIDHIEAYVGRRIEDKPNKSPLKAKKLMPMYDFITAEERINI